MSKESSITVAVRIRPFTTIESSRLARGSLEGNPETVYLHSGNRLLQQNGIRKILNAVDDRMLIFDPSDTNPLVAMEQNVFNSNSNNDKKRASSVGRHSSRIREHRFVFDKLFDEEATQNDVYEFSTKPLLDSVLDGFNATIFAYGATGCGKTFTISGTPENPGIIFLAMQELFNRINELQDTHKVDLSLSYLEIYNETIRDLLSPETDPRTLILREDENKRISVTNLSTRIPASVEEVMDMIIIGNRNRTVSPTEANSTSSRSHAILQINVIQKPRTADLNEEHTFATLSIIDLAGSERASATRNKGARLHEGANINKSLLALGNCINALCDPRKTNHVPYRDSKLTRLLKFSLGGNCKTIMIVCVSPSSRHYDETLNTLKYADRAKEIRTKLIRNQHNLSRHVSSYLKMITEQKREIEELRGREDKMVQTEIQKFIRNRERCSQKLWDAAEELQKSINKNHHAKLQKAQILAKRKLFLLQEFQVEQFIKSFCSRFGSDDELYEIDSFIPGFSEVLRLLEALQNKLAVQIRNLETQYNKPNELDFIVKDSSASLLRSLRELDTWDHTDTTMYERCVAHLKDSVEKSILFESSIMFDRSIRQLTAFDFVYENLQRGLAILLDISSENQEALDNVASSLRDIVSVCTDSIRKNLEEGDYVVSGIPRVPRDQETSQLQSPFQTKPPKPFLTPSKIQFKPSGKRLSSSPLSKAFSKLNRIEGPRNRLEMAKQAKKVRWEVPSHGDSDVSMSDSNTSRKPWSSPSKYMLPTSDEEDEESNVDENGEIVAPKKVVDAEELGLKELKLDVKRNIQGSPSSKLTAKVLQPTDGFVSPTKEGYKPGLGLSPQSKFRFPLNGALPSFGGRSEAMGDDSMMALDGDGDGDGEASESSNGTSVS